MKIHLKDLNIMVEAETVTEAINFLNRSKEVSANFSSHNFQVEENAKEEKQVQKEHNCWIEHKHSIGKTKVGKNKRQYQSAENTAFVKNLILKISTPFTLGQVYKLVKQEAPELYKKVKKNKFIANCVYRLQYDGKINKIHGRENGSRALWSAPINDKPVKVKKVRTESELPFEHICNHISCAKIFRSSIPTSKYCSRSCASRAYHWNKNQTLDTFKTGE